ncbi:hypothetical protein pqer_cds_648 [Pandoravirus quercus]|uniref:Uncharacterized protein n=1 Tax=Pandoravirus quercus TaxID=2107709 RepID=A0A2U7U9L7_9VIRU|nr:hypothetical protein pqer_cds_648 [Pandoravirus quercus]AVK75070.1 hypothetical protein pqer_cds_648 [Pandoravirus quercus]
MQRTRSLARQAAVRTFSTTRLAHTRHRTAWCRSLTTGSNAGRMPHLTASALQPSDAALSVVRQSNAMVYSAMAISACATAAWTVRCYDKYTPKHRTNSRMRTIEAGWAAATAGSLVMAAGTFFMPTALALGPCLGVALLAVPAAGIVQVAFGVVYAGDATPGGGGRRWLAEAILV